jgi:hypothetical protein
MAIGGIEVGQELLNVPMGKMIQEMATAIADAQWQLDKASMTVAELMSGQRLLRDLDTGRLLGSDGAPLPVDAAGRLAPGARPEVIDSRVFFGYSFRQGQDNAVVREPLKVSMMELGFTPTFYQFVDTIIEVRISITITGTTDSSTSTAVQSDQRYAENNTYYRQRGWWWASQDAGFGGSARTSVNTSQVNAAFSSKFSYSVEGSSLLRTKLVPIPPPAILEDRIRDVMVLERAYIQFQAATAALDIRAVEIRRQLAEPALSAQRKEELETELREITGNKAKAITQFIDGTSRSG